MRSHFVVLGLENINEIYYYMVMSKYIFDKDKYMDVDAIVNEQVINIDTVNTDIEYDGHKLKQPSSNQSYMEVDTQIKNEECEH